MSYTVKASTTWGRFAYSMSATFEEIHEPVSKALKKVLEEGGLSVCFRAGGSEAEKALVDGGFMTKEQKRSEVPWTKEAQSVLEMAMLEKLDKLGLEVIQLDFTGEHVIAENKSARAFAERDYEEYQKATPEVQAAMQSFFGVKKDGTREENVAILLKRYVKK